jgi:hypothetical protein
MFSYEITAEDGKVVLLIGDTKGGLTLVHIDAEVILSPADAREIGEELCRAADEVEAAK